MKVAPVIQPWSLWDSMMPFLDCYCAVGGLPFTAELDGRRILTFKTSVSQWTKHVLFLMLPLLLQLGMGAYFVINSFDFATITDMMTIPGLSFFDLVCQIGVTYSNVLANVPFVIAYAKGREEMNRTFSGLKKKEYRQQQQQQQQQQ